MEQYLAKRKILPVHMEKLLRQMDELAVSIVILLVVLEVVTSNSLNTTKFNLNLNVKY